MHVGLQILDDFFKSDAAGGLNKILFFCQPPKGDPKGKNKLTFSDGREENLTGKCVYFVRVNPKVCLVPLPVDSVCTATLRAALHRGVNMHSSALCTTVALRCGVVAWQVRAHDK